MGVVLQVTIIVVILKATAALPCDINWPCHFCLKPYNDCQFYVTRDNKYICAKDVNLKTMPRIVFQNCENFSVTSKPDNRRDNKEPTAQNFSQFTVKPPSWVTRPPSHLPISYATTTQPFIKSVNMNGFHSFQPVTMHPLLFQNLTTPNENGKYKRTEPPFFKTTASQGALATLKAVANSSIPSIITRTPVSQRTTGRVPFTFTTPFPNTTVTLHTTKPTALTTTTPVPQRTTTRALFTTTTPVPKTTVTLPTTKPSVLTTTPSPQGTTASVPFTTTTPDAKTTVTLPTRNTSALTTTTPVPQLTTRLTTISLVTNTKDTLGPQIATSSALTPSSTQASLDVVHDLINSITHIALEGTSTSVVTTPSTLLTSHSEMSNIGFQRKHSGHFHRISRNSCKNILIANKTASILERKDEVVNLLLQVCKAMTRKPRENADLENNQKKTTIKAESESGTMPLPDSIVNSEAGKIKAKKLIMIISVCAVLFCKTLV